MTRQLWKVKLCNTSISSECFVFICLRNKIDLQEPNISAHYPSDSVGVVEKIKDQYESGHLQLNTRAKSCFRNDLIRFLMSSEEFNRR